MRKILIKRSGIGTASEEVDEHTSVTFHLDNGKEFNVRLREEGLIITETTGCETVVCPNASNQIVLK